MLFNSLQFFIFFPTVTLLYFLLPHRFRWVLLLLASCIFYMAFIPVYILILFVTIFIDYFSAILIERSTARRKKIFLTVSAISTCSVLFLFKYFNFFNANFASIASALHLNYPIKALEIILPIGLSFHTFQSLGYVIDVYRGRQKAEHHLGIFALYTIFFPQLVAGPIERSANLLPQFYEKHSFDYQRVTDGLKLMAWGLFKKVVIADRLSVFVETVYGKPHEFQGPAFVLATVFFAFQIYCDFSGYSDIAIGSAQVMGFRLMQNFRHPYFSKSVGEFWTRWHISLSSWFKDYVYIPLGGNRAGRGRLLFNLGITFLLSGLWHGANWTYVVWGALNGFYLMSSVATEGIRRKIPGLLKIRIPEWATQSQQMLTTFCLICFSWIFFRARDISDAFYIIKRLGTGWESLGGSSFAHARYILGQAKQELVVAALVILVLQMVDAMQARYRIRQALAARPALVRWGLYYAFAVATIMFGVFNKSSFIYFQF